MPSIAGFHDLSDSRIERARCSAARRERISAGSTGGSVLRSWSAFTRASCSSIALDRLVQGRRFGIILWRCAERIQDVMRRQLLAGDTSIEIEVGAYALPVITDPLRR